MKDVESDIKDVESGVHAIPPPRAGTNSTVGNEPIGREFDISRVSLERIDQVYRYGPYSAAAFLSTDSENPRKLDLRIIPGSQLRGPPHSRGSALLLYHRHALSADASLLTIAFWVLYFMCSAIRSNVGLAQTMNLTQKHDLGSVLEITPKQVSTGLALFYVCYVVFDFPSNLVMTRLSPRVWMSRIVIAVGIIGACMAAMRAAWSF